MKKTFVNYVLPVICGGIVFAALQTLGTHFNIIGVCRTHSVCEMVTYSEYLPFMLLISALLGVLPCIIYNGIQDMNAAQVTPISTYCAPCVFPTLAANGYKVGQFATTADGRQYKIKAMKHA